MKRTHGKRALTLRIETVRQLQAPDALQRAQGGVIWSFTDTVSAFWCSNACSQQCTTIQ
jgi:hypothetical protein